MRKPGKRIAAIRLRTLLPRIRNPLGDGHKTLANEPQII
ncbi:MAG: hypothetical protein QOD29_1765 [Alphaproteobacteria bacterium]|jgi:hypothetical protein|nr:hypothetical protein [Alphaproteobacteria bacterium]